MRTAPCPLPGISSSKAPVGREMRRRGFTLIEMMLVVAIIGLLATLAVAMLYSARISAGNAKAIANLRTLSTAQAAYFSQHDTYASWADLVAGGYLDFTWAGEKLTGEDGITYTENQVGNATEFEGQAAVVRGKVYIVDETETIREI